MRRASRGCLRVEFREPGAREVRQELEEVIEPAVVEVPQAFKIARQHNGQPRPGAIGIVGPVEPARDTDKTDRSTSRGALVRFVSASPLISLSTRGSFGTQVSHGDVNSPIAVVPLREGWVDPEHAFSTAASLPFLEPHPPARDEVGHPLLHQLPGSQPGPLPSVDAPNRVAIPHGPSAHTLG